MDSLQKEDKYSSRGVSWNKAEIHQAIQGLDKGLFPQAFCKILPDVVAGDEAFCNIMHADTAGTKPSLAYLYWKETGDLSVWKGIAQDAIVMNTDDMACVGCTGPMVLSSTIGRNKRLIPGEVVRAIIDGTREFLDLMNGMGVHIHHAGGETADVGDIVRSADVGFTFFARMPRRQLLVNSIRTGDVVIGLSSSGQTSYEKEYNSGIGSNGLTGARHDVLSSFYRQDSDSYDAGMPASLAYSGNRRLTEKIQLPQGEIPVGKLLLSPTRTYLPVIRSILSELQGEIHGMIHNTGGGLTKVLRFLDHQSVVKEDLFPCPPVFKLIQEESGTSWYEMYRIFNMGQRLEVYTEERHVPTIQRICDTFHLESRILGRVVDAPENQVSVRHGSEILRYQMEEA